MENPLLLSSGLNVGQVEKMQMEQEAAKHGLGVVTAALFLAGEMAGSGVLALPNAMIGTGKSSFQTRTIQFFYHLTWKF